MNWSENAWKAIEPIYNRIINMPFICEMLDGTLAKEKFQFYMAQDAVYLEHFAKVLALISAKANDTADTLAFISFAQNSLLVEKALHESYFKDFGITAKGQAQPACHHYIHFLKSTAALNPVEVGMASVLPCFWVYKAVGDYIHQQQGIADNPYQKWIETYAGEEFAQAVLQAIKICDNVAAAATSKIQKDMTDAFIIASRMEFEFWNSAYKLARWQL